MNKEIVYIKSRDNEKIKFAIKLKETKFQKQNNMVFVEGLNIIKEAVLKGIVVEVFCVENLLAEFNDFDGIVHVISFEIAKKMSDVETTKGAFALIKLQNNELDISCDTLVLDNIQDPGNLGTLIRSAAAFGFKNIILSEGTVSPYNQKVIRSAQGLIFNINFFQCDIFSFLDGKENVFFTHLHKNSLSYSEAKRSTGPIILVLGNEGKGIRDEILQKISGKNIIIPMENGTESLNVAVAGSILMNHFYQIR